MEIKLFYLILCFGVSLGESSIQEKKRLQCKANEEARCVLACPPTGTCQNKDVAFTCLKTDDPCEWKCECKEGFYRDANGVCISREDCEKEVLQCSENEEAKCVLDCPPTATCRNKDVLFDCLKTDSPCKFKCECKEGYYRNAIGQCISGDDCDRCNGHNEHFSCGGACDNVCKDLKTQNQTDCPIKNIVCNKMCYCDPGHARNAKGLCIPIEKCESRKKRAHKSDSRCGCHEEYQTCKRTCPPDTCLSLVAKFRCMENPPCVPGCVCKSGFLRNKSGEPCMPIKKCPQLANSPDFN